MGLMGGDCMPRCACDRTECANLRAIGPNIGSTMLFFSFFSKLFSRTLLLLKISYSGEPQSMVSKLTGLVALAATVSMLARGAAAGIVFVIHTPHCGLLLIDTDGFLLQANLEIPPFHSSFLSVIHQINNQIIQRSNIKINNTTTTKQKVHRLCRHCSKH